MKIDEARHQVAKMAHAFVRGEAKDTDLGRALQALVDAEADARRKELEQAKAAGVKMGKCLCGWIGPLDQWNTHQRPTQGKPIDLKDTGIRDMINRAIGGYARMAGKQFENLAKQVSDLRSRHESDYSFLRDELMAPQAINIRSPDSAAQIAILEKLLRRLDGEPMSGRAVNLTLDLIREIKSL